MHPSDKIVPVREQIAEKLRSDIISGDLAPDTKLNEQHLAARFGVSRGPIRDVLLQLTKEGLLVKKTNVGASVNKALDPSLQQLMIDIRRRIEFHAVRQLKGKLTEDDFDALENTLNRFKESFEREEFTDVTKADLEFHRFLVEKAGGEDLVNLWYMVVLRMRMNYKRIDTPIAGVAEHRAIIEALRKGETRKAVAALRANIR